MYSETQVAKINTRQARNIFYSETSQIVCGLPVMLHGKGAI